MDRDQRFDDGLASGTPTRGKVSHPAPQRPLHDRRGAHVIAQQVERLGPNEGSIHERWDGRWAGSVHLGFEDGRRVRKHVMGHSCKEVVDKMALVLQAHAEKRPIPSQREKVGPFLRRWLDEVAKPTLRASTYSSYDTILEQHLIPGLGRIALAKLGPADVQAFLNRKLESGLSPRRVQYIHAVLRRALVTAERWGMVSRNVAKLVDAPLSLATRSRRSRPSRRSGLSSPRRTTATARCTSPRWGRGCDRASFSASAGKTST